jgi:oxygen-dependent protoporphyrinogen oxidase
MSEQVDTVVVGGGISGLCTAHWLKKRGQRVLVLERDEQVGGTMRSVRENGFLAELGPNSALETTPLIRELVDDLALLGEFIYATPLGKNRFILRNGTLHALPLGLSAFLATNLFSFSAKLRLLKEPFVGRAVKEESIAEFVERRLGREFLDYAIDPFVAGVYAAKPEALSVRAAFPKLYALEERYGGLIRGMVRGRKERKARAERAKDRAESFSFLSGMQQLPLALATELGGSVRCGVTVSRIEASDPATSPGYRIEYRRGDSCTTIPASNVVLATPAYVAADLVKSLSPKTAESLSSIHYAPVVSVVAGFRSSEVLHPLDGFGFLVPSKEERKILGCLWSSSLFPGRAPEGHVTLTTFVGGSRQPHLTELEDRDLKHLVLDELKSIMQISGKPVYWNVARWAHAIPQYELGYAAKPESLTRFESEHPGFYFCSNYRGGIAVGDCVMSARRVADSLTGHGDHA